MRRNLGGQDGARAYGQVVERSYVDRLAVPPGSQCREILVHGVHVPIRATLEEGYDLNDDLCCYHLKRANHVDPD